MMSISPREGGLSKFEDIPTGGGNAGVCASSVGESMTVGCELTVRLFDFLLPEETAQYE